MKGNENHEQHFYWKNHTDIAGRIKG